LSSGEIRQLLSTDFAKLIVALTKARELFWWSYVVIFDYLPARQFPQEFQSETPSPRVMIDKYVVFAFQESPNT
jgi:hypothetical protein